MEANSKRMRHSRMAMRNTMIMILLVVCILFAALLFGGYRLDKKIDTALAVQRELNEQIEDEKARTQEIAELEEYMKTDDYIREVARDKLGLVDEGDIVFKKAD